MPIGWIIAIIIVVFVAAIVLMEIARSKYVLDVNRKAIALDNLPEEFDGIKIVLISDLHQMEFGEYNEMLARKIKLEEPDYIFFAGDMGDSESNQIDAFYDLLESLGDDVPIILVPGNHDLRMGGGVMHKNIVNEISASGAVLLNNARAEMALGDSKIYVYGFCPPLLKQEGVDIKRWGFAPVKEGDLEQKLGKCPTDAPVILLAHDPTFFARYTKWGATLSLCGHMHGGLVRLPFLGGLFGPEFRFRPRYTAGEYRGEKGVMYVTRGLGNDHLFRFGNPPEISVLTLTHGKSKTFIDAQPKKKEHPLKEVPEWFKSEWRSLRELLHERTCQFRDFVDRVRGKEKSRFAQTADQKREKNTYLAPRNRAKENARKVSSGSGRVLSDSSRATRGSESAADVASRQRAERRIEQERRRSVEIGGDSARSSASQRSSSSKSSEGAGNTSKRK